MEIIFATGNKNKVAEALDLLSPLGYEVKQMLLHGDAPRFEEPQSEDLVSISISKASQARELSMGTDMENSIIMVEDSGLFIDSLKGFPGPFSSYAENKIGIDGILKLLGSDKERGAEYRAVVMLDLGSEKIHFSGACRGTLAKEKIGNNGFGFDPIFIPDDGDGRTFAQMEKEEKSQISHRGFALKALSENLKTPSK